MTQNLIYLDDYLKASNFKAALRGLASDFRNQLGLPRDLDELGLVCADVVKAADYLQKTYAGMGTFMLAEGSADKFDENGEPIRYRTRVGFAYYQGVLLELAEAGTGSDIFSTHLAEDGRITIHHMGYFSRGKHHSIKKKKFDVPLKKLGFSKPEWKAKVAAGMTIHVAIYNTYKVAQNLSLEFLDFRLLGLPVDYPEKGAQLLGEFQNKVGPRVLVIGGKGNGARLQWSLHGTVQLNAAPEAVWKALIDPEMLSLWMGGKMTIKKPGVDRDPGGVGAIRNFDVTIEGEKLSLTQTVEEANHPLLLRYRTDNNGIFNDGETVMTITQSGNGSELVWQASFIPKQSLTGRKLMKRGNQWVNESLKRLVGLLGGKKVGNRLIPTVTVPD
jgi:uncharacterized protein YndB with AHSA1/START domain